MNESPPKKKRASKKEQKTYTQQFSSDCDKEPKIKGCQRSPKGPKWIFFYMKFMKNQRNRSFACTLTSSHAVKICSNRHFLLLWRIKSHHHTFVLRAVKIILCGNVVWCLDARFFFITNFFHFFEIHKFSRVINFQFTVVVYYLFICFMSNVNLFFFSARLCAFSQPPRAWAGDLCGDEIKKEETLNMINKILSKFMEILISRHINSRVCGN
jgi:hypothetical protein